MKHVKQIILLVLLGTTTLLSLRAQERPAEPTFLPAVGMATVGDYTLVWEAGVTAVGYLTDGANVACNTGVGALIAGYMALPLGDEQPQAVASAAALYPISVYPNPASEWVGLDLGAISGAVELEFFNALGVRVLQQSLQSAESARFSLRDLPNGLYIVRVSSPEGLLLGVARCTVQR